MANFVAATQSSGAVAVVTTTETQILQSPVIEVGRDSALVVVRFVVLFTTGATAASVTCRIYRGPGLTGVNVSGSNVATIIGAAGSTNVYLVEAVDSGGPFGTVQYSGTVQQAGATANGNAVWAVISAFVQA